jgi:hypothetical protein
VLSKPSSIPQSIFPPERYLVGCGLAWLVPATQTVNSPLSVMHQVATRDMHATTGKAWLFQMRRKEKKI